ncbi:MAG: hypothetical protein ACHQ49_00760 [Elusimicrobiota bacterium]
MELLLYASQVAPRGTPISWSPFRAHGLERKALETSGKTGYVVSSRTVSVASASPLGAEGQINRIDFLFAALLALAVPFSAQAEVSAVVLREKPAVTADLPYGDDLSVQLPAGLDDIRSFLKVRKIKAAGPSFAIYYDNTNGRFQAGVPIAKPFSGTLPKGLRAAAMPGGKALKISVEGKKNIRAAYETLDVEVSKRRLKATGVYLEVYPDDRGTAPDRMHVEIYSLLR